VTYYVTSSVDVLKLRYG